MTARELLSRTSAGELAEWAALYRLEADARKAAQPQPEPNGRASR